MRVLTLSSLIIFVFLQSCTFRDHFNTGVNLCSLYLNLIPFFSWIISVLISNRVICVFKFQGPHLLAPTGSDLRRHGQEGTVFAGYHYDLNFLTIHGRSRFPGLNIWLRNGQKMGVKVPVGCLLIQTGKQVRVCYFTVHLARSAHQFAWTCWC